MRDFIPSYMVKNLRPLVRELYVYRFKSFR